MKFYLKSFLLVNLISLSALMNLWAKEKTNDINIFYNDTWGNAYNDCPIDCFYDKTTNGNEVICFQCDDIILARLEMWNYFFAPHPFENRYHDIKLELETEKYKNKRKNKRIIGVTIIGTISGIIIGKFILK